MSANNSPKRKIFLNYRRADQPDFVERIRDWFAWKYGRDSVFMDFDTIPPFTPFADFIKHQIHDCDVLVAIIGPRWLDLLHERIEQGDDEDYVQLEIRLALEEAKPIAPICIKKAAVPRSRDLPSALRPMLDYHVAHLDAGRHFLDNIEMVISSLEQELSRLDGLKLIAQDIEVVSFDVMAALRRYQEAAEQQDWRTALDWLTRIRQSGFAPAWYPLDDYETEAREGLRVQEADRNYNFIRTMADRSRRGREDRLRVWQALELFWEKYPAYDPDDLGAQFRPEQAPIPAPQAEINTAPQRTSAAAPPLDLSILDQLEFVDEAEADDLFDELASAAKNLPRSDALFTLEQAQSLGLLDVPEDD